jgi:hypothetical protein
MASNQSVIKSAGDQLFLDTALGEYLSNLSGNFGLYRFLGGFSNDDLWRAITRRLAVDYKQTLPVFNELISILAGPKHTVTASLLENVVIGDTSIFVSNWMNLPQEGTLVLDYGLGTAETLEYSFRDPLTGEITLVASATQAHTATGAYPHGILSIFAVNGATSLHLVSAALFPDPATVGNYSVILEADSSKEEVVVCTAKAGNILTVSATSYDHSSASAVISNPAMGGYFQGTLSYPVVVGATKISLDYHTTVTGAGDSLSALAVATQTLTDAGATFTSSMVGKTITIRGSAVAGNNGSFPITAVTGLNTIEFTNAGGGVEAGFGAGGGTWFLGTPASNMFPDPAIVGSYPITLDSGRVNEETVTCTAKSGAVLTVSALTYAHDGPSASFATSAVTNISPDKLSIFVSDIDNFDSEGELYIQKSGGLPTELLTYSSVDPVNKMFTLLNPVIESPIYSGSGDSIAFVGGTTWRLTDAGAVFVASLIGLKITIIGSGVPGNNGTFPITAIGGGGTTIDFTNAAGGVDAGFGAGGGTWLVPFMPDCSVTQAKSGATVQIAQVMIPGVEWDIFVTEQNKVKILLPASLLQNRLVDIPVMHQESYVAATAISAVAAAGVSGAGDTIAAPVGSTQTLTDAGAAFDASTIGMSIKVSGGLALNNGTFPITAIGGGGTTISYTNATGVIDAGFGGGGGTWSIVIPIGSTTMPAIATAAFTSSGLIGIDVGNPNEEVIGYTYIDRRSAVLSANYVLAGVGDAIAAPIGVDQTLTDAAALFVAGMVGMTITIAGSGVGANNGTFPITAIGGGGTTITYTNAGGGIDGAFAGSWYVRGVSAGTTKLYVDNVTPFYTWYLNGAFTSVNLGTTESVVISNIDPTDNSITCVATTLVHAVGTAVTVGNANLFELDRPTLIAHQIDETIDYYTSVYGAGTLEKGEIEFTPAPITWRYQGKYLWSYLERLTESNDAAFNKITSLAEDLAGPTWLEMSQLSNKTALEVHDASRFLTPDYQSLQVGRNRSSWESKDINEIVLRSSLIGFQLAAAATAGDLFITIDVATWPTANGYRIHIANTTSATSEEVVIVNSYDGAGTATLDRPLQFNHDNNEPIQLMADVIKIDALEYSQPGKLAYADRYSLVPLIGTEWVGGIYTDIDINPALVEEQRSYISVVVADTGFPAAGGYLKLNSGRQLVTDKATIDADVAAGVFVMNLVGGALFPAGPNFWVIIGEGTREEETRYVTFASPVLTLAIPTMFAHKAGEAVSYLPGDEETIYYNTKNTAVAPDRFEFDPSIVLDTGHVLGEPVALSSQTANPSRLGTDFPFYFATDFTDRYELLLNLARAAGVQVVFIADR